MVTGTLSEYPRKCAISKTSAAAQSSERERNVHTETSLTASGKSPQLVPHVSVSAVTGMITFFLGIKFLAMEH